MIYYLLPFFSFLLSFSYFKKFFPKQLIYLFVYLLLLALLAVGTLRGEGIGSDYFSYFYVYRDKEDIEIGFSFLADLVKSCGGSFHTFLGVVFAVSISLKAFVFKKMSLYPLLSLMIYLGFWFLTYDMNGIRQGIAFAFTGLATYFVWKKKNVGYWINCACALLLHYSSVIFLPFIFLIHWKCSLRIILFILGGAFLFALQGGITNLLSSLVDVDSYLINKMFSYGKNEDFNENILFSFSTLHRLVIFVMIYAAVPKMRIDDRLKNIFLWGATMNVGLYLLFSDIEIVATRISLYYRFIECLSLAAIPGAFSRLSNRFLAMTLLYIYVFWQVYSTLSMPNNSLVPYYMCL
ncbi:EpsG family protein [uncultured Bacteroides sp.]|uniref:EpsG family protein n=1 Tax=uncultured Bacteroides sp. TaxID=162156 RepID=UPI0025F7EE8B|nr:EpsG family protein [uncultured Bacteroides sp.]